MSAAHSSVVYIVIEIWRFLILPKHNLYVVYGVPLFGMGSIEIVRIYEYEFSERMSRNGGFDYQIFHKRLWRGAILR